MAFATAVSEGFLRESAAPLHGRYPGEPLGVVSFAGCLFEPPVRADTMAAYRFCRTDDIGLLVDALNRCWVPCFPDDPPVTPVAFKRSIRDLDVWCSSCMVAFTGPDPIGVLIGAKRPGGTLVHKIAVHPDHQQQGHGRHLLASLGSKLAILGPPRIVAEVPEALGTACELFGASGYAQEALLTDFVWRADEDEAREAAAVADHGRFVIPVTIDDLDANGLLGEVHPEHCWERSVETLVARKDEISGLAVASDERIEAYLLYVKRGPGPGGNAEAGPPAFARSSPRELQEDLGGVAEAGPLASTQASEILSLHSFIEDGGARLGHLLARLGTGTFRLPKVHPAEFPKERLEMLGFRAASAHRLYATRARSD